jgi:hypothetical protein
MEEERSLGNEVANVEIGVTLNGIAREGARRMIAAALESEGEEYVSSLTDELDADGHRLVVRNGRGKERRVTVGSGTVALRAPRVDDRRVDQETGERRRFSSRILPRYARRSPRVTDVLPILYLRGLSSGDFGRFCSFRGWSERLSVGARRSTPTFSGLSNGRKREERMRRAQHKGMDSPAGAGAGGGRGGVPWQ